MNFLSDIPAVTSAIMTFAMGGAAKLPTAAGARYAEAASKTSPVDAIVSVAECLYANHAAITDPTAKAAAQTLTAQCAAFAVQYGWHDMATRGPGIVAAMRRDLGETAPAGTAWPDPASDPAVKSSATA